MSWPLPICVVGVGSPQGDDALAWAVVHFWRNQERSGLIEFHIVCGGQRLLDVLDGQGSLVLIDALAPAGKPGSMRRFAWPDERLEVSRHGSTHNVQLAEALHLAATLDVLPPKVVVWGMEGETFEPSSALSPAVAAAIPKLVERIVADLSNESRDHRRA